MPNAAFKTDTALDLWALGFRRCTGDMAQCHAHVSVVRWIQIARAAHISEEGIMASAERGSVEIQIEDKGNDDISMSVMFHIHPDWPPDGLVILSTSLPVDELPPLGS